MSFASTPLGQGRRLDHNTFHNKNGAAQVHTARQRANNAPPSYSYGASTQNPRSPPKPASSSSAPDERATGLEETALTKFARLKQQQQQQTTTANGRVVGPRVVHTPPNPERWAVKDTSVNVASAFHRAATTTTTTVIPAYETSASSNDASTSFAQNSSIMNPNDAWASGTQHRTNVPRSSSVEFEKETQSLKNRGLPKPASSRGARMPPPAPSARHADRVDTSQSADASRSVLSFVAGAASGPASFFMRRLSQEPEARPQDQSSSYEYSAEEKEYQEAQQQQQRRRATVGRRPVAQDNKAYNPASDTDYESDDDDVGTEKRTRRRKAKKNGAAGGPLTGFQSINYDKKKKRKKRLKANGEEDEVSTESEDGNEGLTTYVPSKPVPKPQSRQSSLARTLQPPPQPYLQEPSFNNSELQVEEGLRPISEEEDDGYDSAAAMQAHMEALIAEWTIGARLGRAFNRIFSSLTSPVVSIFGRTLGALGDAISRTLAGLGYLLGTVLFAPYRWVSSIRSSTYRTLVRYITAALGLYVAWWILNSGVLNHLPSLPSLPTYDAPYQPPASVPPADLDAFAARLMRLENAFASLSMDTVQIREGVRVHGNQLGALENQVQRESSRATDADNKFASTNQGLQAIRQELRTLHSQVEAQQKEAAKHHRDDPARDDEARALLRKLEERIGTVEGGVKEALELGKNVQANPSLPGGGILDWWGNLASGKTSSLTIKSSDGKDVTGLIGHLVDSAMSKASKDTLARPDFAMYSSGATVLPSLTSETYEIRPQGVVSNVLGFVTGSGFAVGRPPVTALHHDINNGHCWPFPGSQGQLGVMLSHPVHISDVTIDHVPREVATDMRTAPRHMELWGLIEGQDNLAKFVEWKTRRREEMRVQAELAGDADATAEQMVLPEEEHYPTTLPRAVPYMRIAGFAYNIYAPQHIQTFTVPQEVQDLGIDFGVVVLVVRSNWGRDEFTCLYRLRVHGERLGGIPEPLPADAPEMS